MPGSRRAITEFGIDADDDVGEVDRPFAHDLERQGHEDLAFMDALIGERITFYEPPERGFERELKKRLSYWQNLRHRRRGAPADE